MSDNNNYIVTKFTHCICTCVIFTILEYVEMYLSPCLLTTFEFTLCQHGPNVGSVSAFLMTIPKTLLPSKLLRCTCNSYNTGINALPDMYTRA